MTNPQDNDNLNVENTEENLFEDFEPDFEPDFQEDEETFNFDPNTQVIIRYGTEEVIVETDGSQTVSNLVEGNKEALGYTDINRLNFKVESTYIPRDYPVKPGQVIVASATADTKGY